MIPPHLLILVQPLGSTKTLHVLPNSIQPGKSHGQGGTSLPHLLIFVQPLGREVGRLQPLQQLANLSLRLLLVQHACRQSNETTQLEGF